MSNKKSKVASVAVMLACLLWSPDLTLPVTAASAELSAAHFSIGEEVIDNKPYQTSKILIKAKPEQVWQVLTDYHQAPNVFPNLKKCQVLSEHGATKVIHYQIKPSGCLTSFQYDLEVHEINHARLDWKRVDGDFKEVTGYWKLEPAENGHSTWVHYASHVNGGLFMPQALIKRQGRIDLPQTMGALKGHAETLQIATSRQHRSSNTAD